MIGRYHLLQKIGEGGMGEVWLAEQKEPVRRRVALKLVKAGMNTPRSDRALRVRAPGFGPDGPPCHRQGVRRRLHARRARRTSSWSTSPVFRSPTYCDNHRLSTRERLELFMRVCEGVQHAHQKAIIHRDLKPSNILVTEVDGRAAPKIIDFGVAKALTQKLTADTMFTRVGALVGTPEYMSPEQANSSGEDIDTRTDVYSLGIILYELLAGAPPIELRKIAFEEFLRRLREEEPPKPSTKIRTQDPATSTEVARKRQTEPLALARQMRGDLDSIALKALEKDRSRRYGSPSDFAADIGRYLNNEAVLAVPPSAAYRARKFARRYRVALVTACAFVLVLHRGSRRSASGRAYARTRRSGRGPGGQRFSAERSAGAGQRRQPVGAERQARSGPEGAHGLGPGGGHGSRESSTGNRRWRRPFGTPSGRRTWTSGYTRRHGSNWSGRWSCTAGCWGRRIRRPSKPSSRLGRTAYLQGKYPEAEALFSQTLEIQRRVLGPEHPDTLNSMNNLASVYYSQGKYAQAEALDSQILEIRRRVLGPEHPDTLASMNNLANVYYVAGQVRAGRGALQPDPGDPAPRVGSRASRHAEVHEQSGHRLQRAGQVRAGRGARQPDPGDPAPRAGSRASRHAEVHEQSGRSSTTTQGKYAQAEALYSQTLEIQRRVLGPEHPDTLMSMNNLADVYYDRGQVRAGRGALQPDPGDQRRVLGPEHPDTLISMNNLADVYDVQGKYAQAEALFSQTLEIQRRVLGPEHPDTLDTLSDFASMYQRQGKYALAETYAAQALAGRRHALGPEHPDTMASAADLALAYLSQGKFAESEPLAREALEFDRKKQPDDWQRFRAESLLGASLAGQKKYAEAEPLLLEGYQGMVARKDRMAVPDRYHLDRAREWIVQLYQAWGKPEKAAEWKKK